MRYLVDSDWVIDYTHGHQPTTRMLNEMEFDGIGISIIAVVELYAGIPEAPDPRLEERNVDAFLEMVDGIVPLDLEICMIFANEKFRLKSTGWNVETFDLLIGATAIRHGLMLLTNNRRQLGRMEGLDFISSR